MTLSGLRLGQPEKGQVMSVEAEKIMGIEGVPREQLTRELAQGGKFVVFNYCFSFIILSFNETSAIYFIRPGESVLAKGWSYTLLTLFFGWWSLPFGPIHTFLALGVNLGGGQDVTKKVAAGLGLPLPAEPVGSKQKGTFWVDWALLGGGLLLLLLAGLELMIAFFLLAGPENLAEDRVSGLGVSFLFCVVPLLLVGMALFAFGIFSLIREWWRRRSAAKRTGSTGFPPRQA